MKMAPTEGYWMLYPKRLPFKEPQGSPPRAERRRPSSTSSCLSLARLRWRVCGMTCEYRRISERGDTLKRMHFLTKTHFFFPVSCYPFSTYCCVAFALAMKASCCIWTQILLHEIILPVFHVHFFYWAVFLLLIFRSSLHILDKSLQFCYKYFFLLCGFPWLIDT